MPLPIYPVKRTPGAQGESQSRAGRLREQHIPNAEPWKETTCETKTRWLGVIPAAPERSATVTQRILRRKNRGLP